MSETGEPLIWVLQGHRIGDNAQARELARRLGYRFEFKALAYRLPHVLPNLLLGATLASLDRSRSATLAAPWPDLVIGVGKRSVPVARWIKGQAGKTCRLVHLGRPRAPLRWFDLVVTTPQYGLPLADNVIELPLPLAVPVHPPQAELDHWSQAFATLPRPWTGVLVGGARYPFRFDGDTAKRLVAFAEAEGGSLLVSTSPRTPSGVTAKLAVSMSKPGYLHGWRAVADNPHQSILALADRFVVTSDSVSMIAEAAHTGKPVRVFELPRWPALSWTAKRGIGAWLAREGLLTPPREPSAINPAAPPVSTDIVERVQRLVRRA